MDTMVVNSGVSRNDQLLAETLFESLRTDMPYLQHYNNNLGVGSTYRVMHDNLISPSAQGITGIHPGDMAYDRIPQVYAPESDQLLAFDSWMQDPLFVSGEQIEGTTQCPPQSHSGVMLIPSMPSPIESVETPNAFGWDKVNQPQIRCNDLSTGFQKYNSSWQEGQPLLPLSMKSSDFCKDMNVEISPQVAMPTASAQMNKNIMNQQENVNCNFNQNSVNVLQIQQDYQEQHSALGNVGIMDHASPFNYPFEDDEGLVGLAYILGQSSNSLSDNSSQSMKEMSKFSVVDPMSYAPYLISPIETISPLEGEVKYTPHNSETPSYCCLNQSSNGSGSSFMVDMNNDISPISPISETKDSNEEACGLKIASTQSASPAMKLTANPDEWSHSNYLDTRDQIYDMEKPKRIFSVPNGSRSHSEKMSRIQKSHSQALSQRRASEFQKSSHSGALTCPEPGCNKIFPKLYNLKSHLVCHSPDRPHSCTLCEKAFARKHDLQRHLRTIHSANRPFECDICYESFPRADALRRHRIVERGSSSGLKKKRGWPSSIKQKLSDTTQRYAQANNKNVVLQATRLKRRKSRR